MGHEQRGGTYGAGMAPPARLGYGSTHLDRQVAIAVDVGLTDATGHSLGSLGSTRLLASKSSTCRVPRVPVAGGGAVDGDSCRRKDGGIARISQQDPCCASRFTVKAHLDGGVHGC